MPSVDFLRSGQAALRAAGAFELRVSRELRALGWSLSFGAAVENHLNSALSEKNVDS